MILVNSVYNIVKNDLMLLVLYMDRTCVGGIIFNKSKSSIVIVRGATSKKWGIPKGRLEEGETINDGIYREIEEETGLELRNVVESCTKNFRYRVSKSDIKLYVKVFILDDNIKLNPKDEEEISDITWLDLSTWEDYSGYEFNWTIMHLLRDKWFKQYANIKNISLLEVANRKCIRVGGIFINNQRDKVLLVRETSSNLWGIPKGALKFGEDITDGFCRTINEETGMDISNKTQLVENKMYTYNPIHVKIFQIDEDIPIKSCNHVEKVKWVDLKTILDSSFYLNKSFNRTVKTLVDYKWFRNLVSVVKPVVASIA